MRQLLVKSLSCWLVLLCSIAGNVAHATLELRLLCWQGYAPEHFVEKFERYIHQRYNKKVTLTVNNVSDPQEFFDGIRAGNIDIISPAHNIPKSYRWPFIQRGLVLPLNLDNIPNYNKVIPFLQNTDYVSHNDKVYGVPIVYGTYGLAYNTDKFNKSPTSWNVFWSDQYKNSYSISADYYEANIYITALALGYQGDDIFNYDTLSLDPTFIDRLSQLANSPASLWQGVDKIENLSGLSLATAWGFSFNDLKAKGENWAFALPIEGVTGWVDHWLISSSLAKQPFKKILAEQWLNFTLSDEMQLYYLRELGQFPVSWSIAKYLSSEELTFSHLTEEDYLKDNVILWKVLTKRQQNGFRKLWNEAKNLPKPSP